jgi:hypothetical protein
MGVLSEELLQVCSLYAKPAFQLKTPAVCPQSVLNSYISFAHGSACMELIIHF